MTSYFYDTEFLEDGNTIELISIGIVSDGGREYYAVNSEMNLLRIWQHPWLKENVLPHLPVIDAHTQDLIRVDQTNSSVKPKFVIANEVRDFLTANSENWKDNQLWANYGAYDHVVLCQLWGPMRALPKGIPMFTRDLQQLWWDAGCPEKPPQPENDHHALADAKYNMALWHKCIAAFEGTEA